MTLAFDPLAGHRLCLAIAEELEAPGMILDAHLLDNQGDLLTTTYMSELAAWSSAALCGADESSESEAHMLLTRLEEGLEQRGIVVDLIATGFVEGLPSAPCAGFLDRCGPRLLALIAKESPSADLSPRET
jgi:hypothetical protein